MKKIAKLSLVAAALAAAFALASCSNSSDSSGNNGGNNGGATQTASPTTSVAAVTTKGTVVAATTDSSGNKTATLAAANGSYTFTESAGGAAANIAFAIVFDSTKGGKWTFTETDASIAKYKGSYTGNISQLGQQDVRLDLTVEKLLCDGSHKEVSNQKIFSLKADAATFSATIPAVSVGAVSDKTTTVKEINLTSDEVANKIFSGKDSYGSTKYYRITGGKCYRVPEPDNTTNLTDETDEKSKILLSDDGKMRFCYSTLTRKSGSGLYATWSGPDGETTVNSNGTFTGTWKKGDQSMPISGAFTSDDGLIIMKMTMGDRTSKTYALYDGTKIYTASYHITFIKNIN